MPEIRKFEAILIETDLGHGRKKIMVVDASTGEVVAECWLGDVREVFASGANALIAEVVLSREAAPNGRECWHVADAHDPVEYGYFWRGSRGQREAHRPRRGGKRRYLRLYPSGLEAAAERADDATLGAFLRLARHADIESGRLVGRGRRPLDYEGLARATGYARRTLARKLSDLEAAGLICRDEGGYRLAEGVARRG